MKKWYAIVIVLAIAADRLVKLWARKVLAVQGSLPLIRDVFHFTYVENRGAAFGMLQGQFTFFYIITAVLSLALLWILFVRDSQHGASGLALALLWGGALGNFYDRAFYGFVVDMFDFRLIDFAVFNVADSCISVGVFLWALLELIKDAKREKAKKERSGHEAAGGA